MEPGKAPLATDHFHSWLQSFKSTTNTYNNPLPLANSNKDWAVVFSESNTESCVIFLLNAVNNLSMQTRCLPGNKSSKQITACDFCLCTHLYQNGNKPKFVQTLSVRACQSECASPGGGKITEKRHGAAGCQSKDLYRAVAAAETDIGWHGMYDKSRWTGGTRLKNQENTLNRAEGGWANQEHSFYAI